jgi:Arc/MetJ-type ribon-helix-helix transcriptional regulator
MSLENERFVDDLVASGQFASREAVLDQAVQLLRVEFEQNGGICTGDLTAQEWCDRFDQWADSHKTLPHEADDSRESIYAGRGE